MEGGAAAGRSARPLRDPARDRPRRLRRRLRGLGRRAGAGGGHQDVAAGPDAQGALGGMDPQGGRGGGAARPPRNRHHPRRLQLRGRPVSRDGAAPGVHPRPAARRGPASGGGSGAGGRGDGAGARPRPRPRSPAPGPQAGERLPLRGRQGEAPRLRARPPPRNASRGGRGTPPTWRRSNPGRRGRRASGRLRRRQGAGKTLGEHPPRRLSEAVAAATATDPAARPRDGKAWLDLLQSVRLAAERRIGRGASPGLRRWSCFSPSGWAAWRPGGSGGRRTSSTRRDAFRWRWPTSRTPRAIRTWTASRDSSSPRSSSRGGSA